MLVKKQKEKEKELLNDLKEFIPTLTKPYGRINRSYCINTLIALWIIEYAIYAILNNTVWFLNTSTSYNWTWLSILFFIVLLVVTIILTWFGICLTIKRLHDTDHPWPWIFLGLIPLANLYLYYLTLFKKGTTGPNRFGVDPLEAISAGIKPWQLPNYGRDIVTFETTNLPPNTSDSQIKKSDS